MGGCAVIVAGFGFRARASAESLASAFARAGGQADALATAQDKAASPAFQRFAGARRVIAVSPVQIAAQETRTRSSHALAARGTGSLAEAAALAAAGPGARLIGARVISEDGCATCALAQGAPE
ncbi:MAG: cobalamin biosynthesis protein [Roseinatronobacter sp.]